MAFSNFGNSSRESTIQENVFKVILIGDHDVGKSSFLTRYLEGTYSEEKIRTYGVDFKRKDMYIGQSKMTFNIWDTAGHEDYRMITANFLRGSSGILVVFDLLEENTFKGLKEWMQIIQDYADENALIFLIGNKQDKLDEQGNPTSGEEKIQEFAKDNDIRHFFRVSAKTDFNIKESFQKVAEEIHQEFEIKRKRNHIQSGSVLTRNSVKPKSEKEKKGCC